MTAARGRALLAVAGVALISYGLIGVLGNAGATKPLSTAIWVGGLTLVHDLVLAPVVAVVGWLLSRALPDWARPIVQGGLVVAGVVVLLSIPVVLRQGAPGTYDSLLPLDYRANLVKILAVIAVGTALLLAVRSRRRRGAGRDGSPKQQGQPSTS